MSDNAAQKKTAEPQTLSVREAAVALGVNTRRVYELLYSAKLEAVKQDGVWLISAAAVEERRQRLAGHAGSGSRNTAPRRTFLEALGDEGQA